MDIARAERREAFLAYFMGLRARSRIIVAVPVDALGHEELEDIVTALSKYYSTFPKY